MKDFRKTRAKRVPMPKPQPLRAGAAMIDITPKAGTHLAGSWGTLRRAEAVGDRLYARALVFESGGRKLCFVAANLAKAERVLGEHPAPVWTKDNPAQVEWEWMDAAMLMSVELERARSPDYDYEIQVLRIGRAAFVGLPGEPFVEGQLAIKIGSPTYPTYIAHGTTDYAGYIAPRESHARGGTRSARRRLSGRSVGSTRSSA